MILKKKYKIIIIVVLLIIAAIIAYPRIAYSYDVIKYDGKEVLVRTNVFSKNSERLNMDTMVWIDSRDINKEEIEKLESLKDDLENKIKEYKRLEGLEWKEAWKIMTDSEKASYRTRGLKMKEFVPATIEDANEKIKKIEERIEQLEN
jgi:hypothetical protein